MNKDLAKICLILPYFGKLPPCWGGWLDSCADNPSIDFLIITDQIVVDAPENVHIVRMEWYTICKRLRTFIQGLGYNRLYIGLPYKLCDYRPAYGALFQEYISGYDYWGYIDCDLIWGNLRKFLDTIHFENYDRIYRCGHLSIYRNVPEINTLFTKNIKGCRPFSDIIATSYSMNFDEVGINDYFDKSGLNFLNIRQDVTFYAYSDQYKWKNFRNPELGEIFVKEKDGSTWVYYMTSKDTYDRQEVNYIHFMTKKNIHIGRDVKRPYYISRNGIFDFYRNDVMKYLESTISTEEKESKFRKYQVREFRKSSLKKFQREIKFNKWRVFKTVFGRVKSYCQYLKYTR
jgi:hypothetical protein